MAQHHELIEELNAIYEHALATGVYLEDNTLENPPEYATGWREMHRPAWKNRGPLGNHYTRRSHMRQAFKAIRRPLIRAHVWQDWQYDGARKEYMRGPKCASVVIPRQVRMQPILSPIFTVGKEGILYSWRPKGEDTPPVQFNLGRSVVTAYFYGEQGMRIFDNWLNVHLKRPECLKGLKIT